MKHGTNNCYCRLECRCKSCREAHRVHAKKYRRAPTGEMHLVAVAYAEMYGVSPWVIWRIGTRQLMLCKSDEARRILIYAIEAERAAGRKANAAMNARKKAA